MISVEERELSLVERFVSSFEKLDELIAWDSNPVALQLAIGDPDQYGLKRWQPIKIGTDSACIEQVYSKLPGRFPPLFERLVLSYRWAETDLQSCRLLANPPGPNLTGLFEQMSKDKHLWKYLLPAGFIRFGMGTDMDYDPVCFDISSRKKNGDCRIVKIDHEEILCNDRVKIVAEIAPSFEDLMVRAIG